MLQRVDVIVALVLAGAIAAIAASHWISRLDPLRAARGYLGATAIVVALRVAQFVATYAIGLQLSWVSDLVGAVTGVASLVLLGALYGIAVLNVRRGGFEALLRAPQIGFALCLSLALQFTLAGIGKLYFLDMMQTFFAQSGYSKTFLHFIITTEVLAGVALLLPWRWAVNAAIAGLAVDMAGAIWTHVHNGDPLDDSSGAIGTLLRLAPLAVLYLGRRWAVLGAAASAVLAIAGSAQLRTAAPVVPPVSDELDYFVGGWRCAGAFANGKPIESYLQADRALDGNWLVIHHDDQPPNRFHALFEWHRGPSGWVASVQDSFGGMRTFRSAGWNGPQLVWDRSDVPVSDQRFIYRRIDAGSFELRYATLAHDAWHDIDTLTCQR